MPGIRYIVQVLMLLIAQTGASQFAFAQSKVVTGKIIDGKDRSAVSHVSVTAKGTHTGTQTDSIGNFRLTVPLSIRTLTVSAIGFSPQDINLSTSNYVEVLLISTASSLDEVVVIGYGTAKRKDLTGAVASVSEKDFNNGIFASPDQLIQGKVSGVQIMYNNGQPGGAAAIKIRGNSALTGIGQPLYVIDGVPLDGRSMQAGNNPLNLLIPMTLLQLTC